MSFVEKVQQLPEGKRRFLMVLSMIVFSFLILAIVWKSFERNLGIRLGGEPQENTEAAPGFLQSLVEDVRRITSGEEPLIQESRITNQESAGIIERVFSFARETRRVVKYNAGEIGVWARETGGWFWSQLR
jgi:hypothetical protein